MSKRKDGSYRYDGHWRKVRQQVLERDDHRCQLRYPGCRGRADEVDHGVDVAMGGALYDVDNCRAVCGACHRRRSNAKRQRSRQSPPSQEWPTPKALEEP
jgi:5-methylcytosine-specific restriction protein A